MIGCEMTSFPQIILASQSPARAEILTQIRIPFIAIPSEINETETEDQLNPDPERLVMQNSIKKAQTIISRIQNEQEHYIVIGCDTLVLDPFQKVMGKPRNRNEAKIMLQTLSGHSHTVLTGCTIIISPDHIKYQTLVSTTVKFRTITETEIDYYLNRGEWQKRAGSYAIQGLGAFLIDSIQGDYFTVVGLPISWIWQTLINHFGVEQLIEVLSTQRER